MIDDANVKLNFIHVKNDCGLFYFFAEAYIFFSRLIIFRS